MPLPTSKDDIDWNNPAASCAQYKKEPTNDQQKDCRASHTYGNCISTVNEFVPLHNQDLERQGTAEYDAKHSEWADMRGQWQGFKDRKNGLAGERKWKGNCRDLGDWNNTGNDRNCGKNCTEHECQRTENQINNDLPQSDYLNQEPKSASFVKPKAGTINAKVPDCCINEVNIVNSSVKNTDIKQSCVKDGVTVGSNNVNSSGGTSGTGSTKIVDSSVTSSSQQQQYMIIAIVIISIMLSSSVLLLLLLS